MLHAQCLPVHPACLPFKGSGQCSEAVAAGDAVDFPLGVDVAAYDDKRDGFGAGLAKGVSC